MQFFSAFPKVLYSFDLKNDSPKAVTNIFSRFKIKEEVLNNAYIYYKYQLQEGDTPEIVAHQQYGDATLHWVVCVINGLQDPQFDFPLPTDALERYIIKKYNLASIANSYAQIHHYELEVENTLVEVDGPTTTNTTTHIVTLDQYDYKSNTLVHHVTGVPISNTAYFRANNADANSNIVATLTVKSTYKPVYVYDYENDLNDAKREIKLLKREYVQAMSLELNSILNG